MIDGQHRLYGYAGSPRAENELIPVVAFVNLEREEQVKLFMQINENQQAVPKNLRNTLNSDLLWTSPDYKEQIRALKLRVAQFLGEDKTSPLCGRILIGENTRTPIRCVTIDAIRIGLDRSHFIGEFTKSEMKVAGTLYRGNNEKTYKVLTKFLAACFTYVRMGLNVQWELGSANGGFVFINPGVESLIRIFGDILDHLIANMEVKPSELMPEELASDCEPYIDVVIKYLNDLALEEAMEIRQQYGSGGGTKYWRKLQVALHEVDSDFSPPGFDEYLLDQEKQFNTESIVMVRELEIFLNDDIKRRLQGHFGNKWFKAGVPLEVQQEAVKLALDKNQERDENDEVQPWSCLYLIHYYKILSFKSELWQELYAKRYTRPGEENKSGKWTEKISWLQKLNRIRNLVAHNDTISEEDYEFLGELTSWLIKGQAENEL